MGNLDEPDVITEGLIRRKLARSCSETWGHMVTEKGTEKLKFEKGERGHKPD